MQKPFLFVALDCLTEGQAFKAMSELSRVEGDFGFKLNLDYFLEYGLDSAILGHIQSVEKPLFVDLKMWNGTSTMKSILRKIVKMEVEYTNVYALADDLLPEAIKIAEGSKTKVLGLTVLSHYTDGYCRKHFSRSLIQTVDHFAEVALRVGCHGIILPGISLDSLYKLKTIKVVPGVRPKWYKDSRHAQEIEPRVAIEKGATHLVCGSPIMKSADRMAALRRVLNEMEV